jgi:hypothetical protein
MCAKLLRHFSFQLAKGVFRKLNSGIRGCPEGACKRDSTCSRKALRRSLFLAYKRFNGPGEGFWHGVCWERKRNLVSADGGRVSAPHVVSRGPETVPLEEVKQEGKGMNAILAKVMLILGWSASAFSTPYLDYVAYLLQVEALSNQEKLSERDENRDKISARDDYKREQDNSSVSAIGQVGLNGLYPLAFAQTGDNLDLTFFWVDPATDN